MPRRHAGDIAPEGRVTFPVEENAAGSPARLLSRLVYSPRANCLFATLASRAPFAHRQAHAFNVRPEEGRSDGLRIPALMVVFGGSTSSRPITGGGRSIARPQATPTPGKDHSTMCPVEPAARSGVAIPYSAVLDVPWELFWFVHSLIHQHRKQADGRKDVRVLSVYAQTELVLRRLRDRPSYADPARDVKVSRATARRHRAAGIEFLAEYAPDPQDLIKQALDGDWTHLIVGGTLIPGLSLPGAPRLPVRLGLLAPDCRALSVTARQVVHRLPFPSDFLLALQDPGVLASRDMSGRW